MASKNTENTIIYQMYLKTKIFCEIFSVIRFMTSKYLR